MTETARAGTWEGFPRSCCRSGSASAAEIVDGAHKKIRAGQGDGLPSSARVGPDLMDLENGKRVSSHHGALLHAAGHPPPKARDFGLISGRGVAPELVNAHALPGERQQGRWLWRNPLERCPNATGRPADVLQRMREDYQLRVSTRRLGSGSSRAVRDLPVPSRGASSGDARHRLTCAHGNLEFTIACRADGVRACTS